MSDLTFFMSDDLAEASASAFAEHQSRIRARLPDVEIPHIGGTSIPGLLTTVDVDIQVRVKASAFAQTQDVLTELYEPPHPEAWTSEAAFFEVPGTEPHVELALTVVGSLVDVHHDDAWRRIAEDQHLVARYNALTRHHEGGSVDEFLAAKRNFFNANFPAR